MAIQTQDFYEGAALYRLLRRGNIHSVLWVDPFFEINKRLLVYLKHTKGKRSPWGFTLLKEESLLLKQASEKRQVIVGLVCGKDGIAAVKVKELLEVTSNGEAQAHIACHRRHNEYYEVKGPLGNLKNKVAPSEWERFPL